MNNTGIVAESMPAVEWGIAKNPFEDFAAEGKG